jgi:6-bladed beta-propeller protein
VTVRALSRVLAVVICGLADFDAGPLIAQSAASGVVIGVLDGDQRQVFGRIRGVAHGPDNGVFILDDQARTVSWFSRSGEFNALLGGEGDGPGEFRSPEALAVSDDGRLHVLDRQLSRITVYSLEDGTASLAETIPVPMRESGSVNALCRREDSYLVLGVHEGKIVHELKDDGTLTRSFGESVVEVPPELEQYHGLALHRSASLGRLLCYGDLVIVALEQLGSIRVFTSDGRLLWRTELEGFRQLRWVATRGGRGRQAQASGTGQSVRGIALFGPDTLAVSVMERVSRDRSRTELRLLDVRTGSEIGRRDVPATLAATTAATAYWYVNGPFPYVTIAPRQARQ